MKRYGWNILNAALLAVLVSYAQQAWSATITLTGTTTHMIDVPTCAILSAAKQDSTNNLITVCNGKPPDPVPVPPPLPGPGCAGFGANAMEIGWPTGANINMPLSFFGPNTALVVHFKVTGAIGDTAKFTLNNTSGPNYTRVRASLSATPGCNTPSTYPPPPSILWAQVSQNPPLEMIVGTIKSGSITVQPNTDYWVTIVNRSGYPGYNTCSYADCGTARRIDFNN